MSDDAELRAKARREWWDLKRKLEQVPDVDVPTEAEAIAMLEDLYSQIPPLECKGLCHDTCTAIDASELERRRLRERGVELSYLPISIQIRDIKRAGVQPRCPALGPLNNCTVYDVRPMICRAFGVVYEPAAYNVPHSQPMMCDRGCIPDGTMNPREFARVMLDIEMLSELVTGVSRASK